MYAVSPPECAGLVSPGFLIRHISLLMLFLVTVTVLCENSTGFGGGCSVPSLNPLAFSTVPATQGSCDIVKWVLVLVGSITSVRRESAHKLRVNLGRSKNSGEDWGPHVL